MEKLYLDYAATTPVLPTVYRAMQYAMETCWGNPDSTHLQGRTAANAFHEADVSIKELLGVYEGEIIYTASGSEANNLAMQGYASAFHTRRINYFIASTVHHSMRLSQLLKAIYGERVIIIPSDPFGQFNLQFLLRQTPTYTLQDALICLEWVNNETGSRNISIKEIINTAHKNGAKVLVDAVQALPHMKIDVSDLGADFVSFAAHKIGGPKGIGALYVKDLTTLSPLVYGGKQQYGLRAGTLDVPSIIGFERALRYHYTQLEDEALQLSYRQCVRYLRQTLQEQGFNLTLPSEIVVPGITHLILNQESSFVASLLAEKGICVSTGAACSGAEERSVVLQALGLDGAKGLRISYGFSLSKTDIDTLVNALINIRNEYGNI